MKQYKICEMKSCEEMVGVHGAKGLCPRHYRRLRVHGDPSYVKFWRKCKATNCDNIKQTKAGYCVKHYKRFKRGGNPNEPSKREARGAVDMGDHLLIPLGVLARDGYAIVDLQDRFVEKYLWSINLAGYAQARVNGTTKLLHHLIMGKPKKPYVTDHINRNKLDNRRVNLRFVTERENALNKRYAKP
jgi:hypothetical protein